MAGIPITIENEKIKVGEGADLKIVEAAKEQDKKTNSSRRRRQLFEQKGDAEGSIQTVDVAITDRFDRRQGLEPQKNGEEFKRRQHGDEAYKDGEKFCLENDIA